MKKAIVVLAALLALTSAPFRTLAQDSPKPDPRKPATTTLKVHVTITESEGEKKLSNLPYTFFVNTLDGGPSSLPSP